jgi:hypothetical protein
LFPHYTSLSLTLWTTSHCFTSAFIVGLEHQFYIIPCFSLAKSRSGSQHG